MGFLKLAEDVEDFKQGEGADTIVEIFDSSKAKVLADLALSIEQAKGRYEGAGQGAASTDNPVTVGGEVHDKAFASPNWKPQTVPVYVPFTTEENKTIKDLRKQIKNHNEDTIKEANKKSVLKLDLKEASKRTRAKDEAGYDASRIRMHKDGGEMVRISIKCKGAIIDGFLESKHGKLGFAKTLQISSNDLIKQLESYQDALAGMDKDSAMGKHWHNAAVHNSIAPQERTSYKKDKDGKDIPKDKQVSNIDANGKPKHVAHCLESDTWVKILDVKQTSPYPTLLYK